MRKDIIGGVCVALLCLTTQGAAQQPSGAPPQRTPAAPPKTAPRTPPTPAGSPYCMFEGKEFSIGAVLCVSSQMSQVCSATDTEHNRPWWSSGRQALCAAARPSLPTPVLSLQLTLRPHPQFPTPTFLRLKSPTFLRLSPDRCRCCARLSGRAINQGELRRGAGSLGGVGFGRRPF